MKTFLKFMLVLSVATSLLSSCAGGYYVSYRPSEPYYARPAAPYPGAYWVPAEWEWRNGNYVYINGYWTHPRYNHIYIAGHWKTYGRRYIWVHGHWR